MEVLVVTKQNDNYIVDVPKEIKEEDNIVISFDSIKEIGKVKNVINTQKGKIADFVGICTELDYEKEKLVLEKEKEALTDASRIAKKLNLEMKILRARYDLYGNQLLIEFYSEKRVDFRDLAKELASIYKTRIELRQVGIRDKAKIVGGYGPCGQRLCCQKFLSGFEAVSINMAKNQNISLNPTKINGVCGRLLCCLKYEDNMYSKCKKCLPKKGDRIETEKGSGMVVDVDVLQKKYKVSIPNAGIMEFTCGED